MAALETETITKRIKPDVKAALRTAAEREHRSLANMIDVMILDWCGRKRVLADPRMEPVGSQHGE